MLQVSADELQRIKNAAREKQCFWLLMRALYLAYIQYINILVGSLETPIVSYFKNSSSIAQAVDNGVRSLGINRSSFCLLLSDVAKYVVTADAILESVYPKPFHVTYVAHFLHNCTANVKSYFENIDRLIAQVKSATFKNKIRQAKFSTIGCLPQHVVTRWGS